jgi:hypothetical protein
MSLGLPWIKEISPYPHKNFPGSITDILIPPQFTHSKQSRPFKHFDKNCVGFISTTSFSLVSPCKHHHHHHHHHHISVMELGHLLTRSGLTYPKVSSNVCHNSFFQMGNIASLPWVIYYEAFYLHVILCCSFIPVICPKLVLADRFSL